MRIRRKAWYVRLVYGKYPPSSVSLCKFTYLLACRFPSIAFGLGIVLLAVVLWWGWFVSDGWVAVWGPLVGIALGVLGVVIRDAVESWKNDRPESLVVASIKAWRDKVCPRVRIE